MKILVIEDTAKHQQAARLQLVGHDLTVAGTYEEGQCHLNATSYLYGVTRGCDEFKKQGIQHEDQKSLAGQHVRSWDIVLIDLMLPAPEEAQRQGSSLVGQEMPLGTTLAFLALKTGIKKVAIVTDTNHHDHPASAALDVFGGRNKFQIGDAEMLITNHGTATADHATYQLLDNEYLDTEEGVAKYPKDEHYRCQNTTSVKPWIRAVEVLLGTREKF